MSKLVFYYSGMNAGKSAHLLQKAHNLESKDFLIDRFTYRYDNRYGKGKIASRVGIEAPAKTFSSVTMISKEMNELSEYVFIDEAQFLSKLQVLDLTEIVDRQDIDIFCYGLRTDFRGKPFTGSSYLMAWADEIVEVESFDSSGRKATMNIRLDDEMNRVWEGKQTKIGFNYESIHRSRFNLRKALGIPEENSEFDEL